MHDLLAHDAPAKTRPQFEPVAPWPHTLFLLAVFILWALYGLQSSALAGATPNTLRYTTHILLECLLAGTTVAGLYQRRCFLFSLMGSANRRDLLRDVAQGFLIYLLGAAAMVAIWMVLKPFHLSYKPEVVRALAPRNWAEMGVFTLLSLAAGVCEEFVFRGYLLRQLQSWWGSTLLAVALSSVLFGCLHVYEGVGAVVEICGLGAMYAIVAVRRGNIRSVMVAHFLQDALTGLFLYLRPR